MLLIGVAIIPPIVWAVASLVVSRYVYDLSEVSSLKWVATALPAVPHRWLLLHAGLDEWSERVAFWQIS